LTQVVPVPPAHRWRALGEVYVPLPLGPSPGSFGLTVGGVLAAIAAFSAWRRHVIRAEIVAAVSGALLLAAALQPAWLRPLARGWGRAGHALGWVNSRVLLTLLFVVVLCPVGAIARLLGSDPLGRRRSARSYWMPYSSRSRDRRHYERMF
jgi:hypothetical protein